MNAAPRESIPLRCSRPRRGASEGRLGGVIAAVRALLGAEGSRDGGVCASYTPGLIAVFNGGFQAKHGGHGMMIGGDVFLPPIPAACTVGIR